MPVKVILAICMGASAQLVICFVDNEYISLRFPVRLQCLFRLVFESCFEWDVARGPGSSRAWSCGRFGGSRSAVFLYLSLRLPALWPLNPAIRNLHVFEALKTIAQLTPQRPCADLSRDRWIHGP